MTTSDWTTLPPEEGKTYGFRHPTGRLFSGIEQLEMRLVGPGGIDAMSFEGDWAGAVDFGLQRTTRGKPWGSSKIPTNLIYRFPETMLKGTDDQEAEALLLMYFNNVQQMLETRALTPELSVNDCRVRAAQGAMEQVAGINPNPD